MRRHAQDFPPNQYRQARGYRNSWRDDRLYGRDEQPHAPSFEAGRQRGSERYESARRWRERSGPKGYVRSDERIKDDVCERLYGSEDIEVSDVSVEVKGGKVTLEGTVPERHMKHRIEDVVDECIGVQDIQNHIRVQRAGEASEPTRPNAGSSRRH